MRTTIYTSLSVHPHQNLAAEEALMQTLAPEQAIFFLWQNAHTVVIGAGQNAWSEVDIPLLQSEQGTLARRSSGGGAVYHDLGNVNFSFIMPPGVYDVHRQLGVILQALSSLGISAQFSGRNDLVHEGRKFSGNAFRQTANACLHHGTLMLDVDISRAARYLKVDPQKRKLRGVASVPSRVINLREIKDISLPQLQDALVSAFSAEYGSAVPRPLEEKSLPHLSSLLPRYQSWAWNYGQTPDFSTKLTQWFDWGGVTLFMDIKKGAIQGIKCYSDAMDETLPAQIERALLGCPLIPEKILKTLKGSAPLRDVAQFLSSAQPTGEDPSPFIPNS